jgi:hypothetical protein
MKSLKLPLLILTLWTSLSSSILQGQTISTQERFQDLFVTAGYGTAFGAAMGAALLSFQSEPDQNLRYVAVGASLGFIGGSILGSYVVFSPVFQVSEKLPLTIDKFALGSSSSKIIVKPTINPESGSIQHIESVWQIALE